MTVSESDIKFRKSVSQTDTDSNGGRKGSTLILSGSRHALFPRVTKSQLDSGLVRYRKEFYCNENESDETAYGVLIYMMRPSNADDHFHIAKGTQKDIQSQFNRDDHPFARIWCGVGQLSSPLSGGESSVSLDMESSDSQFPNDGYLYLSNNTMTGQTLDSDISIGNSVEYSSGSWSKIDNTTDITYPKGWCVDTDEVLAIQDSTNEEFLRISKNEYSGEVIGTGDGSTTNPDLSTLTNNTNGICRQPDLLPVVTTVCGGTERTVDVAADGSCSGYCSAGQLDMSDGSWTTDIDWTTAPDDTEDITITYCERAVSWSGNTATVSLQEQVANSYATDSSYGSGCIYEEEVACDLSDWSETSSSGTYDESGSPVTLYNDGTVEDDWTISFTGSSAFSVSGNYYGSVGSGNTGENFSPTNPDTGQPYFTILASGWGGTWESGDTITFTTSPSALPILIEQTVPAGTTAASNNLLPIGAYTE